jgi:predicted methyltransferase
MTLKNIRAALPRIAGLLLCALAAGAQLAAAQQPAPPAPDYAAIVASPDRSEADRKTDARRKQPELLAFTGIRPGMRVLDMGADAGYSTELDARAAAPGGVVYGQNSQEVLDTVVKGAFDERMKRPAMANVVRVVRDFNDPVPPEAANLDVITFFFAYHDLGYMNVDRARMDAKMFAALKPGGHLIFADHSAKEGSGTSVTKSLHRIDEALVRRELEAAGFRLAREGQFMRNPADTRDVIVFRSPVPVDEFVLDYVKP